MQRPLVTLLFGALIFAAISALAPVQASAQVNDTGTSALTIAADPSNPAPNSTVLLTAESPLLDLSDSDIEWTVNGAPAGSGSSIKIQTGALGQETDVAITVSGASGNDSAELSLVPTSIALLWEADSYVPPFYRGRAEPGSGSMIRVMAIPQFVEPSGTSVPSSDINFTWKLNGGTDEAQSGIGESSAVFPAAVLYDTDVIEVDAQTIDGTLSGEADISVRTQAPQLVLYEDDPLFGVMYHAATPASSVATESETSYAAVPYFANATSANDPSLAYAWTVNGSPVATDAQDPSEITIDSQSSGVAQIGLSVSNPSDPFFSASGSWQVSFNGGASSANNVFQSAQ